MQTSRFLSLAGGVLATLATAACSEPTAPPASPASASLAVTNLDATVSTTARVRFHPHSGLVTTTQAVSGMGNVHQRFSSIQQVCLTFAFSGDLLDPEDTDGFHITVDGVDAGGFFNPSPSEPQADRTLCWNPQDHPTVTARFLDGRAKLKFLMDPGSVRLTSITLTITGTPR